MWRTQEPGHTDRGRHGVGCTVTCCPLTRWFLGTGAHVYDSDQTESDRRKGSHKQRLCGVYASSRSVRATVLMIVFDVVYCRLCRSYMLQSGYQRQGLFINFSHHFSVRTHLQDLMALKIRPTRKAHILSPPCCNHEGPNAPKGF